MKKITFISLVAMVLGLLLLVSCSQEKRISYSTQLSKTVKGEFSYIDTLSVYQITKPLTLQHTISIGKKGIWTKEEVEAVYQFVIPEWRKQYMEEAINEDEILSMEIIFFEMDDNNKTIASIQSFSESDFTNWSGEFYVNRDNSEYEIINWNA